MKGVRFIVALFGLLAMSAIQPQAASPTQYRCGSMQEKGALVLPIPSKRDELVFVSLHGREIPAVYNSAGLEQFWNFNDAQTLYILVRPQGDLITALYMDFRDAEPGERRKPESVFFCE